MAVPFLDLTRLTQQLLPLVQADWNECLTQGDFVGGPRVTQLEEALCRALVVPHAVACASGTDALILALTAAGVVRGSKVALPNLTFWATYEAVAALGATPILIDSDPEDLAMSFDEFAKAFEVHRFDAAILVHLFGWSSARLRDFRAFCNDRNLPLVEDGAQAFGVRAGGISLFSEAQFATLSFYPAKVIGGAMDGGAVLVSDANAASLVRALGNHGREDHFQHRYAGYNSRMSSLQAAYLNRLLPRCDEVLANRAARASQYRGRVKALRGVRSYGPPEGVTENGYLAVMAASGRSGNDVANALGARGIGAGNVYPRTVDEQPAATTAIRFGSLAHSKAFCRSVFNVPLFYGMRDEEFEEVLGALSLVLSEDKAATSS